MNYWNLNIVLNILFKINSETDEQALLQIYNTAAKRINTIRALKILPKAEEKKEEKLIKQD